MQDVIVIGGSYAGMAAALQLLRARRKVLIIDAGERRNRFASHSHGFLGQDGVDPAVIHANARDQLMAYQTLEWIAGRVIAASGQKDDFVVETAGGTQHRGRRLLFATGVRDELPKVPGLADRWGRSVFHCPYCHGYELDQGSIGVIGTGPMSVHQAQLLPEWGETTLFTNGVTPLDAGAEADLGRRGVTVERQPIAAIEAEAEVVLTDGRRLHFAGLFTAPRCTPASDLAAKMGCRLIETPMGVQIATAETKETDLPGVFACGDAARVPHSVSLAVGDGAWAGAQLHRSLVWPEG